MCASKSFSYGSILLTPPTSKKTPKTCFINPWSICSPPRSRSIWKKRRKEKLLLNISNLPLIHFQTRWSRYKPMRLLYLWLCVCSHQRPENSAKCRNNTPKLKKHDKWQIWQMQLYLKMLHNNVHKSKIVGQRKTPETCEVKFKSLRKNRTYCINYLITEEC